MGRSVGSVKDTVPGAASPNDGPPATGPATLGPTDGNGRSGPQPHMQVDLEMGQDDTRQIDPMSDHPELLDSARRPALRNSAAKDLRTLILRLEEACERARVAAISALHDPASQSGGNENTDHNFGFAKLFAALRRARTEMAARGPGHPRRASPKTSRNAQSVVSPARTHSEVVAD